MSKENKFHDENGAMKTKSIKIHEYVHDKLKVHVAKKKRSLIWFSDMAILDAIKADAKALHVSDINDFVPKTKSKK